MTQQEKIFIAFMEGVCKKLNCVEAVAPLSEGFKAYCETADMTKAFGKACNEGTGYDSRLSALDYPSYTSSNPSGDPLGGKIEEYYNDPNILKQRRDWYSENGKVGIGLDNPRRAESGNNLANHLNRLLAARTGNADVRVEYVPNSSIERSQPCLVTYKGSSIGFVTPASDKGSWRDNYQTHYTGIRYWSYVKDLESLTDETVSKWWNEYARPTYNVIKTYEQTGKILNDLVDKTELGKVIEVATPEECCNLIIDDMQALDRGLKLPSSSLFPKEVRTEHND